jgi:thiol-disulfide isomerase/thioredoxin
MKKSILLIFMVTAFAAAAAAQGMSVGTSLDDLRLVDGNGKAQSLKDVKGAKGTALIFVSSKCPVVRSYNDRMNRIATDYKAKGINVIGVNANINESPGEVKMHGEATYNFPVLIDKDSVLADKLGANRTPEAFFFDARSTLLYHGAIDDDRAGTAVTEPYLRNAFDASLAGKKVERATTAAFGCSIQRPGSDL